MPVYASLVIVAVVWIVSLTTSTALRSYIYSLPIPMSVVLVASHRVVSGQSVLGVADLVLFFFVVAGTRRLARSAALALVPVVAGVVAYTALALLIAHLAAPPMVATMIGYCVCWLVAAAVTLRRHPHVAHAPARDPEGGWIRSPRRADMMKLIVLTVATFLMVSLASVIKGLVVTFPYSGTLVAVDLGDRAYRFATHFVVNSITLVAFLGGYYLVQGAADEPARVLTGWGFFLVAAGAIQVVLAVRRRALRSTEASV